MNRSDPKEQNHQLLEKIQDEVFAVGEKYNIYFEVEGGMVIIQDRSRGTIIGSLWGDMEHIDPN